MRHEKVLMTASVASMIDQFNLPNIRLIQQMGYQVHVACNFEEGNTCDRRQIQVLQRTLHKIHAVWHQWDCPRDVCSGTGFAGKSLRAYGQLQELIRQHGFVWIHCHSPVGGVLTRIAAHQARIPVIYTAHGFHFYQGAPFKNWLLYYPVERLLAHWTEVLITVNKEDYCLARRNLRAGRVCYIPGVGIDTGRFRDSQTDSIRKQHGMAAGVIDRKEFCRKYRIPEQAVILLSVGELSRRKNHQTVISVLEKLHRQDVYYVICGQGAYRKKLMRQAETLGIASYIRMTGFQKDVENMYRNADIFVFPSRQEGMPAALMEAMASGLVCAVSDIRGNRELIGRKGGFRFMPDDTQMLRKGLERLLDDPASWQAYGRHNRQKIREYDLKIVMRRTKKIYAWLAAYSRYGDRYEDSPGADVHL